MLAAILIIVPCPFVVWCHVQLRRRASPGCGGGGGSRVLLGCVCLLGGTKKISWMVGAASPTGGFPDRMGRLHLCWGFSHSTLSLSRPS